LHGVLYPLSVLRFRELTTQTATPRSYTFQVRHAYLDEVQVGQLEAPVVKSTTLRSKPFFEALLDLCVFERSLAADSFEAPLDLLDDVQVILHVLDGAVIGQLVEQSSYVFLVLRHAI